MLQEIKKKYETFSDSLINEFQFRPADDADHKGEIRMAIRCMNSQNNYQWEVINLVFEKILEFKFFEHENTSSTVINSVLIEENNGIILFDFFPLISSSHLTKNSESDLYVRCGFVRIEG